MSLSLAFSLFVVIKYLALVGFFYILFWQIKPRWALPFKIQKTPRAEPQVQLEVKFSFINLLIQFFFWYLLIAFWSKVHLIQNNFKLSDTWSFAFYFLIYDPYFYFLHRFMHRPWFYKNIHVIHHRSLNPTPWGSYSFHPLEGVLNILYFIPFVLIFNPSIFLMALLVLLTDLGNIAGHVGYDFTPVKTYHRFWGRWLTTPTHHNLHHQVSGSNFGLYLRLWDSLFKTLNLKTDDYFIKNRSPDKL